MGPNGQEEQEKQEKQEARKAEAVRALQAGQLLRLRWRDQLEPAAESPHAPRYAHLFDRKTYKDDDPVPLCGAFVRGKWGEETVGAALTRPKCPWCVGEEELVRIGKRRLS